MMHAHTVWLGIVVSSIAVAGCRAEGPGDPLPKPPAGAASPAQAKDAVIDHTVTDIDGKAVSLASFRGKAIMVVNVASECGYTPQYEDLQRLYARYQERGLVVLGFPSNDFGGQEPGSPAEIKAFAHQEYGVTFPLFEKVHATGDNIAPLYKTLTTRTRFPGPVTWNFTKFLVNAQGQVVARFSSDKGPLSPEVIAAVEAALPSRG